MIDAPKEPLTLLFDVPVDESYHLKLLYQIESRGGVCTRTGVNIYESERYGKFNVYVYNIKFPQGTYRVMGEAKHPIHPYVVYFSDGHKINGSIIQRETVLPGEQATIEMLYPLV